MPSIEFHGYTNEQVETELPRLRERLAELPYRDRVVFSTPTAPRKVTTWGGAPAPFLRVLCNRAHSQEVASCLRDWDIEIVYIEFIPRSDDTE